MRKKRILLSLVLIAVALGAAAAWVLHNYHVIDWKLYEKDAQSLNLRGQDVSIQLYEQIREKLPDCEISWDVPFQDGTIPNDAESLTLTALSQEDLALFRYFPELKAVDATLCEDIAQLPALHRESPELELRFDLKLDGISYQQDARHLLVSSISEADLALLDCMEDLSDVTAREGGDAASLVKLRDYCDGRGLPFRVCVDGKILDKQDKYLTITNVTDAEAKLLQLMPWLKTLHLPEPEAKAELVLSLVDALPETRVTWEKPVLGLTFDQDTEAIDLTPVIALGDGEVLGDKTAYDYGLLHPVLGTEEEDRCSIQVLKWHPLPDKTEQTQALVAEVEAAMEYFPKLEYLRMCGAWLHNETMSDFREAHREDYKVAWSVQCGKLATRTDATFFMPVKYHVYYFFDADAYNLRYCEDIVSMDIGHLLVSNLDFVRFMPNLKYLVLSWTNVRDLSPLASCKNLAFFEINWMGWKLDYSPLVECTGLEDLNIGETWGDITPILEMTWLKNLWMVGCSLNSYMQVQDALTETNVAYSYADPVIGWRALPNYFGMRDELYMFYMKW